VYWSISRSNTETLLADRSLQEDQLVNHFSNYPQLTRKDYMYILSIVNNIKIILDIIQSQ
jgi:hypothetical protein